MFPYGTSSLTRVSLNATVNGSLFTRSHPLTAVSALATRLLRGDARALSQLMTLVERGDPATAGVMQTLLPHTGHAYRVGITGPPGAGKSTLVDALTNILRQEEKTVGILAVDPSSPFSGGAVLGDRIRMQRHYMDRGVFIRSTATRGGSGGLSRITHRMTRLLEAAGKDVVMVETVGVGQTELNIMGVADTVVVVLVPEAGDAVQTMKAGLMEIGDVFVVNKADRQGANQLAGALEGTLNLNQRDDTWRPAVLTTQAHNGEGVEAVWEAIGRHRKTLEESSQLQTKRRKRRRQEFFETVGVWLDDRLRQLAEEDVAMAQVVAQVEDGDVDPYTAAANLLMDSSILERWLAAIQLGER